MHRLRTLCATIALIAPLSLLASPIPWTPIKVANGHLMVETTVSGITGWSIVDSGSKATAINEGFLHAHNLDFPKTGRVQIEGIFQRKLHPLYGGIEATIFGSNTKLRDVVGLDLSSTEIQLLIGSSLMRPLVLQFDYPNQQMRAVQRKSFDLSKLKNVQTKRDTSSSRPLVRVTVDDKVNLWLILDTGFDGGIMLDRETAQRYGWLTESTESLGVDVNSSGMTETFNLPSVQLGPYQIPNLSATVPARGENNLPMFRETTTVGSNLARNRRDYDGLIGLIGHEALRHFVLTLDYARAHVHIAVPGSNQDQTPASAEATD